jgi:hypothetical protein
MVFIDILFKKNGHLRLTPTLRERFLTIGAITHVNLKKTVTIVIRQGWEMIFGNRRELEVANFLLAWVISSEAPASNKKPAYSWLFIFTL